MEEGWLIPSIPAHDNQTGRTLELWFRRNHKAEMIPEDWESIPAQENSEVSELSYSQ